MIDFSAIKDDLYDLIVDATSLEVVWGNQNNPYRQDSQPHFSCILSVVDSRNHDYMGPPDNSGVSTFTGDRELTLLIHGFGTGIVEKTSELRDKLQMKKYLTMLDEAGLVLVDWMPVLDISGLYGTEFEERSSFDVRLRTLTQNDDNSVGLIETINAEGELNGSKQDPRTMEISVTAN